MQTSARLLHAGTLLHRALKAAARDRVTANAASLAFHWFLAVLTAAVAGVGVIGLVGLTPGALARLIRDVQVLIPVQLADTVSAAVRGAAQTRGGWVAATVGGTAALWSAIEAMAALQVSLDIAFEVRSDLGFVVRRLRALPLMGCTMVLGGAAFALLVLGDPIRSLLPVSFPLARSTFGALWELLRWAGALLLVMTLLSLYYKIGPNRPRAGRWISSGALVGAAGWMATSAAFSFYLDHFGHESRTYGAFAGVAVLLLWLYLAAMAVLLGAELDRQIEATGLERQRRHGLLFWRVRSIDTSDKRRRTKDERRRTMSQSDDWSPDEPLGTEVFEQGDEALDEDSRVDPDLLEDLETDPSLDRTLRVDERELEEAGAEFDDPEVMVTLEGGMDDPDGLGEPSHRVRSRREGSEGWDLDAPLTTGDDQAESGK